LIEYSPFTTLIGAELPLTKSTLMELEVALSPAMPTDGSKVKGTTDVAIAAVVAAVVGVVVVVVGVVVGVVVVLVPAFGEGNQSTPQPPKVSPSKPNNKKILRIQPPKIPCDS
jgi:hypothetical protein